MESNGIGATNPLNTYWGAGTIVVGGLVYAALTEKWVMFSAAVVSSVLLAAHYRANGSDGDSEENYRNVYCPDCGAFVPRYYSPLSSRQAAKLEVRTTRSVRSVVECPKCDGTSVIVDIRDESKASKKWQDFYEDSREAARHE